MLFDFDSAFEMLDELIVALTAQDDTLYVALELAYELKDELQNQVDNLAE